MNDIIQLLPDSVANQIAAGEVIQRPASVVKELMENAIDAGATSVQVIIKDAGRTLIQVIDNGKGMSMADARLAFERHATSKIKSASDLFALQTMGFRGEALASIAAIAHVELKTRREEDEVGTMLVISGSQCEKQEAASTPVGSNFMVKNIFFNVPARRKFLKSNQTEFSNIIHEFERIALVNPNISLSLYHNDNEVLNLHSSNLRQRIISVFGKSLNQQLLSVEVDTTLISVSGYIGRPEAARKKNGLQYFFVNGRYMRNPYFHKAVMQSYEKLIPQGEMPNYFLYLNVDPANIDVNIHPTKTEIKFENESFLWQIINATVKESLGKFSAVPSIDFDMIDAPEIPVLTTEEVSQPKPHFDSSYNPFQNTSTSSFMNAGSSPTPSKANTTNWQKLYGGGDSTPMELDSEEQVEFEGDPDYFHTDEVFTETPHRDIVKPDTFSSQMGRAQPSEGKIFGGNTSFDSVHYHYKGRYILTSVKSGLMMIDQHRAHVRVLFEGYMTNISKKQGVSQKVLFPDIINFSPSEIPILESILPDLEFLGFELNSMGGVSYAINGVPSGIEGIDMQELIHTMVVNAQEKARDVKTDLHELVALTLANAAAIPYGHVLNQDEMERLIDDLFASTLPNYTPDGKIILSVLTNNEITNRFK